MRVLLVVLKVKISRSGQITSSEGDTVLVVCDCEALAEFPGEQKLASIVLGYFFHVLSYWFLRPKKKKMTLF